MCSKETVESPQNNMERKTWSKSIDFVLTMFGMSIGLGNVWRFPYLCYKNGGGVFLIAYLAVLLFVVLPTIILELAVGQYTRDSAIRAWQIIPLMKGIGHATCIILVYADIYYPVILAWALRWLVAGFSIDSPWTTCNNTWNNEDCIPLFQEEMNFTKNQARLQIPVNSSLNNVSSTEVGLSSVEEFWKINILSLSGGLEEFGNIKWDLALCLLVIWIFVYFSVWKGISWTSKVVYVTATLPLVMIVIVLVRGATLEGASDGIQQYLRSNTTKLLEVEVWTDAASQVMYSFVVGCGALTTLSSHNQFHHNLLRDAAIVSCANAITSFTSGFAIFSVLGHLAQVKNTSVSAVAESGPGLVFVAYPTALSFLPLPNCWIVLFFLMLILLGLDSVFVIQDGVIECLKDLFPKLFRHKWNHEIGHAVVGSIMFLLGLSMVTPGGIYIFHVINTYSVAGWCIYFIVVCECTTIAWLYGASKFCRNIQNMVRMRIPRIWLIPSWTFIAPLSVSVLMFYSLYQFKPLTYDRTYIYPTWANVIAWCTAFSSVLCVPAIAAKVVWNQKGKSFREKLRNATTPREYHHNRCSRCTVDG
ncbi:sodium- and chloride-dependent taurine transporter-like isoform X1 [Styela clava]